MEKQEYEVKVWVDEDNINLFSIYLIESSNSHDAEQLAKSKFYSEVCNGRKERKLDTFVINNPDNYKNYVAPYLEEIQANM